jgi:copper chaperone CopZ
MFEKTKIIVFNVEGMHCSHCQAAVQTALKAVKGVKKVEVSLEQKTATVFVKEGKVQVSDLMDAVKNAGFEVTQ